MESLPEDPAVRVHPPIIAVVFTLPVESLPRVRNVVGSGLDLQWACNPSDRVSEEKGKPMSRPHVALYLLLAGVGLFRALPTSCQEANDAKVRQLIQTGVQLYDQGEFQAAIDSFTQALALEPPNAVALYERALAYIAAGDPRSCVADAQAGLELDSPLEARFYTIGGSCFSEDGKTKKALRFFQKGLKRYPEDTSLHFNVAITLANSGKGPEARSHLQAVLRREPDHPSANLHLASLYQEGGYRVPAAFQYLRFLAVEPSSQRSAVAAASFLELLNFGLEKTGEEDYSVSVPFTDQTDEGDFDVLNLSLSLLAAAATTEEYQELEPAERLAKILDSLVAIAQESEEAPSTTTFVWDHAIAFLIAMRDSGVLEPFSYVAFSQLRLDGAEEWVTSHREEVSSLNEWLRRGRQP